MCVRRCSEDSVGVNLIEFLYIRTLVCEGAKLLSARHSGLLGIFHECKLHIFQNRSGSYDIIVFGTVQSRAALVTISYINNF